MERDRVSLGREGMRGDGRKGGMRRGMLKEEAGEGGRGERRRIVMQRANDL